MNKLSLIFRKAPFSAFITIISFILFVGVYWILTMTTINPYYSVGLIFAIPFVLFGIITYLTAKGILGSVASTIITVILIVTLGFILFVSFIFISIDAATTVTTDIGKYNRVLKMKGYPDNLWIKYFPEKIPDNANDVLFSYNPAFIQGGERLALKFETDPVFINHYINELSDKVKWKGKSEDSEAAKNGIFSSTFSLLGYSSLPEDFTIYLIMSKPYQPNNWNHGEFSLVAISQKRDEIIFLAEDW